MANDRLWLRCPECRELLLLYKYYPLGGGGGYWWANDEEKIEKANAFFDKHLAECFFPMIRREKLYKSPPPYSEMDFNDVIPFKLELD